MKAQNMYKCIGGCKHSSYNLYTYSLQSYSRYTSDELLCIQGAKLPCRWP